MDLILINMQLFAAQNANFHFWVNHFFNMNYPPILQNVC